MVFESSRVGIGISKVELFIGIDGDVLCLVTSKLAAESVSIDSTRLKLGRVRDLRCAGRVRRRGVRPAPGRDLHRVVRSRSERALVLDGRDRRARVPCPVRSSVRPTFAARSSSCPAGWALVASGAGILILLMFLPEGLGGILYAIRDGLLRRVARRRGLIVPSLLADVRAETDETDVDLAAVLAPPTTARRWPRPSAEWLQDGPKGGPVKNERGGVPPLGPTPHHATPRRCIRSFVLFGLNAVDELDRTAFNVLLPNIRDWFGLSLTSLVG